jgi:hypothetical protein
MRLCTVAEIVSAYTSIQDLRASTADLPDWLADACPVAKNLFGSKMCFVLLKDMEGHGRAGSIVTPR